MNLGWSSRELDASKNACFRVARCVVGSLNDFSLVGTSIDIQRVGHPWNHQPVEWVLVSSWRIGQLYPTCKPWFDRNSGLPKLDPPLAPAEPFTSCRWSKMKGQHPGLCRQQAPKAGSFSCGGRSNLILQPGDATGLELTNSMIFAEGWSWVCHGEFKIAPWQALAKPASCDAEFEAAGILFLIQPVCRFC